MQEKKPQMLSQGLRRVHKLRPAELRQSITPAEDVFVLAHMGVPEVTAPNWSLTVEGLVARPLALSYEQLRQRPKREVESVHVCAGNPLDPTQPARQAVNVIWGGADLASLLSEAAIAPEATHLWAYGLDHGQFAGQAQDHYLKDLPLSRLAEGDLLVAYELNGAALAQEHGFPVRLVVPGYYGTNCVKWLSRITLADRRATGLFTSTYYNDPDPSADDTKPVWALAPQSLIVQPGSGETFSRSSLKIWGWAWADTEITTVTVSCDGGESWQEAQLEPRHQRAWQRFTLTWPPPAPGRYRLLSRAWDAAGQTQPLDGARNAVYGLEVTIAA